MHAVLCARVQISSYKQTDACSFVCACTGWILQTNWCMQFCVRVYRLALANIPVHMIIWARVLVGSCEQTMHMFLCAHVLVCTRVKSKIKNQKSWSNTLIVCACVIIVAQKNKAIFRCAFLGRHRTFCKRAWSCWLIKTKHWCSVCSQDGTDILCVCVIMLAHKNIKNFGVCSQDGTGMGGEPLLLLFSR
jgi:hypothetical protein